MENKDFDAATIEHVSKLARLRLSDSEKEKFVKQINDVLGIFGKIDSVDASGLDPAFHPIKIPERLREDVPEKWKWDPFYNSRQNEGKYIKSPRIV
ncbi:MAG: Asp-tRNA(Asn)/Glu-tRNA(Gln) amidotransferase subunit GatC [Candidatus Micrarchaeia archaeon]